MDEREPISKAIWAMVDPLRPPGQPGSYWRGQHNGIIAAARTAQEIERRIAKQPAPQDERDQLSTGSRLGETDKRQREPQSVDVPAPTLSERDLDALVVVCVDYLRDQQESSGPIEAEAIGRWLAAIAALRARAEGETKRGDRLWQECENLRLQNDELRASAERTDAALAWVMRTHVRDLAIIDQKHTEAINAALGAELHGGAGWLAQLVIDKLGGTNDLPAWVRRSADYYAQALKRADDLATECADLRARAEQAERSIRVIANDALTLDECKSVARTYEACAQIAIDRARSQETDRG